MQATCIDDGANRFVNRCYSRATKLTYQWFSRTQPQTTTPGISTPIQRACHKPVTISSGIWPKKNAKATWQWTGDVRASSKRSSQSATALFPTKSYLIASPNNCSCLLHRWNIYKRLPFKMRTRFWCWSINSVQGVLRLLGHWTIV